MTVSIVIPAYGSQEKLDLNLASLSTQSYPVDLTEVIVVDDGSDPPLLQREPYPANLKIIPNAPGRWGIAAAVSTGIEASTGSVILRLDSDIVVCHHHVEAHMRWHHLIDYAVTIGKLAFADIVPSALSPQAVQQAVASDNGWTLFDGLDIDREWTSKVIRNRKELRNGDIQSFKVANGASIAFSRQLYANAGGLALDLVLGEDTELSYRLSQQGAVFIPDRSAEAWHIGESQMRADKEQGMRYRQPFFASRVPLLHHHRNLHGVNWRVPLVEVVVDVRGHSFEAVAATVGSILGGDRTDVSLKLLGTWPSAASERYPPLDDPDREARLTLEAFGADQRVTFVDSVDPTAAPVPYRLSLTAGTTLRHDALQSIVDLADKEKAGRVNSTLSRQGESVAVRLDRTAAVARARWETGEAECPDTVVDQVWGVWWADGDEWFGHADGTSTPWIQPSGTQRELDRMRAAEAEQRRRAERWKRTAEEARAEASRWEAAASSWEQAAARWTRTGKSTRKTTTRGSIFRRAASGLKRRVKRALRR
jgi:GT2 family glycosyltransferase